VLFASRRDRRGVAVAVVVSTRVAHALERRPVERVVEVHARSVDDDDRRARIHGARGK
jgi:hypothetical protein